MKRTKQPKKKRRRQKLTKEQLEQYGYPGQKGNKIWMLIDNLGIEKKYPTPEKLRKACMEYFKWVDDNPYIEEKPAGSYKGSPVNTDVKRKRPYTIDGLCISLNIVDKTWREYRERDAFSRVCLMAEKIIKENKFSGAAAGFFNHAIIARDLGLVDRKDLTTDGEKLPAAKLESNITVKQAERQYKDLLRGNKN